MGSFFVWFLVIGGSLLLLFFPFYLDLNAYYDLTTNKFAFSVLLFKRIKLIGGYATTYSGGIAFHISPKKALLIDYSEMDGKRKKFSFMRAFKLKELILTAETGAEYLLELSTARLVGRLVAAIKNMPRDKIKSSVWLTNGDVLKISLRITVLFSVFILLKAILKFLKEKIKILWKKKLKKSVA